MWNKDKSLFLSRVIVKVCYVLLAVSCFVAPVMVRYYDDAVNAALGLPSVFVPLLVTLYCAVPAAGAAIYCLDRLLTNISHEKLFINKNVSYLRIISWCCFIEAAVFIYFSCLKVFALMIVLAFAFLGLVLRIVKNVFQQAVSLREENDYTI